MSETTVITMRKSAMVADGEYDYQKLIYPRNGFLPCYMEEEKEEVHFTYQIEKCVAMTQIRNEKPEVRLAILMDIANLYQQASQFQFSIAPENIYYDLHHRVYVMQKDLYERGCNFSEEVFISEYKALIGYSLQKRYSFANYKEGGEALLKKSSHLKAFYEAGTVTALVTLLEQQYQELLREQETKKVLVSKVWYEKSRVCLIILLLGLLGSSSYLGYQLLYVNPYQEAVIMAADAYLDADYVGTVDHLQNIAITRLNHPQKYMLAVAYVKSENLADQQKKNILAGLSFNSSDKLLEYWIYMGRLEVAKAQNIAIQISDDQLLLYAYLKEKLLIETNTQISGEEKVSALNAIESKIKPLAEKFEPQEDVQ